MLRDVSLLLFSLCVDGELLFAEGYTQLTGVMTMMTGRVLLVCALCVLWCGAGGRCDEEEKAVPAGDGGPPLRSAELETSRQDTQELKVGSQYVNVKVPPEPSPSLDEEVDDGIDDNEEEELEKGKKEKIKHQHRHKRIKIMRDHPYYHCHHQYHREAKQQIKKTFRKSTK
ncbi:mucin-associated surface protein (MASP) [Trypanosoma cruzi]|nr:mucin-associated surface protein (MASP) [Trypanosoma cruzi]